MSKLKMLLILCVSISVFAFYSCNSSKKLTKEKATEMQEITYMQSVKPIIKSNCMGCHSGGSPAGSLALTSYKQVRDAAENGYLLARIRNKDSPMPKSGLMDTNLIEVIEKWAKEGYKLEVEFKN